MELIYLTILLINIQIIFGAFPDYIERCHYGDVECVKRSAINILQDHPNGVPEIRIPKIEPFFLKNATFGERTTAIQDFKLHLSDIYVNGLSKVNINRFVGYEKDPFASKFEMYGTAPKLKITSKYSIMGNILRIPINGEGNAVIYLENIEASMKIKMKKNENKNDVGTHLVVDKSKVLVEGKNFKVKLENLFNGNKALGDAMNLVLNENSEAIWEDFKPDVNKVVGDIAVSIINDVMSSLSYEDLFKDN